MVFGFLKKAGFVRPETIPLPRSASSQRDGPVQLRTPSPSADSAHGPPLSRSPSTRVSRDDSRQFSPVRPPRTAEAMPPPAPPPAPEPEPTAESLSALIASIPAKTLHAYVLARLPAAPGPALPVLHAFFAHLAPPPRLHCVRCHKDYVDVENDDRSCLVAHDDESAEVERVGRTANRDRRPAGDPGSTYETLWGCCGKTVEGDGDQGPPDGWCYEGKHTTDAKRARFRADSTPYNDKLVSCLRLNCHGIRNQLPRTSARKRARNPNLVEPDSDEDASEGEADSGVEEIVGKGKSKIKEKKKDSKPEQQQPPVVDMVQVDEESASQAGSVRKVNRSKAKTTSVSAPPAKRRGRPPKAKAGSQDTDVAETDDAVSAPPTKRRGRQPKSKEYIEDSDAELGDANQPESISRPGPRTRSISRTRVSGSTKNPVKVAAESGLRGTKANSRVRKTKAVEGDVDGLAEDDQPKKKRKVAS
ncbi:hypothetical protein BKA93DRAFT_723159 [Sparassis latifolia]